MRPFTSQTLRPLRSLVYPSSAFASSRVPVSRFYSSQLVQSKRVLPSSAIPRSNRTLPSLFRFNSSAARPLTESPVTSETDAEREKQNQERRQGEEAYQITFTCKPCGERSSHRMSKQGYHRGTVLIQCPSCKNRHVMSDHLGIFFDKSTTLEDLLKEQGQTLTHGQTDGNLEIWDDGSLRSSGSGQALPDESAKSESS
ncbi:uncharacterized protein N7469_003404 [Penicillium citrinum]|uniref:DNL-type domain-containing protein n=2 Tax=Penicillium TaxID=5073 RepID=A0A9W9P2R7_PENCI|nr:uncharacterized protein N7469_003404 [Penicillium citrinum]KAJ5234236.1 hypothetical protein N7469_003404 [Penicillium citrinum]KAJ5589845.1 hypothetical protein N7450_003817 [Penicillium hetheringtonii]KAK5801229.1 hypothetical protein VI817_003441 [Penicillium citrinum]